MIPEKIFKKMIKTIVTIETKSEEDQDFIPYLIQRLDFFNGVKIIPALDMCRGFGILIGGDIRGKYFPIGTELKITIKEV